jgi:hypothetical protein
VERALRGVLAVFCVESLFEVFAKLFFHDRRPKDVDVRAVHGRGFVIEPQNVPRNIAVRRLHVIGCAVSGLDKQAYEGVVQASFRRVDLFLCFFGDCLVK